MKLIEFELRGDYITLDALLKVTGLADSGGAGKAMVAEGQVEIDGRPELRKTCKVRAGQIVSVAGAARVRIHAPTMPAPLEGEERPHEPPDGPRGSIPYQKR